MKKYGLFAVICLFLAFSGCGVSSSPANDASNDPSRPIMTEGLGEGTQVKLFFSKAYFTPGSSTLGTVMGYIEISNTAYAKQVVVHYCYGGAWSDLNAKYVKQLSNNKEVWYFNISNLSYNASMGFDFQFAVRYSVSGVDYWDNNGGSDYKVGTGPRNSYPDVVYGKSMLAMGMGCYISTSPRNLSVRAYVKNTAVTKTVKVIYTTNNWSSSITAPASYTFSESSLNDVFDTYTNISGTPASIKYKIQYTVNGATYLDDNYGRYYSLTCGQYLWE